MEINAPEKITGWKKEGLHAHLGLEDSDRILLYFLLPVSGLYKDIKSKSCPITSIAAQIAHVMFIAHIPSGYIMSVLVSERVRRIRVSSFAVVGAGMAGAIAPDIDMFYFYFIDHRQTHHHKYITHWPVLWLFLVAVSILWLRFTRDSKAAYLSLVFSMGGVLHLILDSFVGDIWLFAPFINRSYAMFTVPALYHPWWLNFFLHWSFAVELVICVWALVLYRRRSSRGAFGTGHPSILK
jgi:hypothetical protein